MAINLTGIVGDLANALPNSTDLINQVVTGAAASVFLAGLKTQSGTDAVDPFHLFHKNSDGSPAGSVVVGRSITSAAFASLPAASQAQILGAGYVIAG